MDRFPTLADCPCVCVCVCVCVRAHRHTLSLYPQGIDSQLASSTLAERSIFPPSMAAAASRGLIGY